MSRNVRVHVGPSDSASPALAPKHLTKQEFGRRLYRLMLTKGWNQSQLAREAKLTRNQISTYIRGVSLPEGDNLPKLAKALGVTPESLLPNVVEAAIDNDFPAFEMKVSTGDPSMAWVRVNRLVTVATAVKIADLLQADDVLSDGRGSGDDSALRKVEG